MNNNRLCESCMACCTYFKITPMKKGPLEHCLHADIKLHSKLSFTGNSSCGNCGIYKTRPQVCRDYKCAWLLGYGDNEDRPDKSGMIIDTILKIENCFQAKPLWDNAHNSTKGKDAIKHISRDSGKPIAVAGFQETHMIRIVGRGLL